MTLQEALIYFSIDLSDELNGLSFEGAKIRLEAIKIDLKSRFRQLAKYHHPDQGGSDEDMKQLIEAYKLLQQVKIIERQPIRAQMVSVMHYSNNIFGGFEDATSAGSSGMTWFNASNVFRSTTE